MTFLMDQAAKYRGRFVEVTWTVAKTGATFQLTTKFVPSQSQPTWMLYRGTAADSELVWGHTSNDLTLMHNLVALECEKPSDGNNTISASSMDHLLTDNRDAGAFAGAARANTVFDAARTAGEMSGNQGEKQAGLKPADTWLKNLTPGKPDGATTSGAPPQQQMHPIGRGGTEELATLAAASTDGSLNGNLVNITIPKLIGYLSHKRSTGRLSLKTSSNACDVYMQDGQLAHAVSLDARGEMALLDAATWTDGEFSFKPLEAPSQQTLSMPTADIVVACQGMLDYSRFLQQNKLHAGSYLNRAKSLTRAQFEKQVQEIGPTEPQQLWRLFELIDGNRCLSDLLRLSPMMRAEWIPALYTLVKTQLISIADQPRERRPGMFIEGVPIDQQAIDSFAAALADPNDLALRRHAFLFLLQQEHFRYERSGAQYALALFNLGATTKLDSTVTAFSSDMMRMAVECIGKAKRKLDVIGHFDQQNHALLLPETDGAGAAVFANRICELLARPPISMQMANQVLVASFGIASVPHDVRDLSGLIAAARSALSKSKMTGAPVCVYGDG